MITAIGSASSKVEESAVGGKRARRTSPENGAGSRGKKEGRCADVGNQIFPRKMFSGKREGRDG